MTDIERSAARDALQGWLLCILCLLASVLFEYIKSLN